MKQHYVTEIFYSIQGKGKRTPAAFKGKSTNELGFTFKLKD